MPLNKYAAEHLAVAIDCVIFGFDGKELKLLLIHRGFEPKRDQWSLMGGFVKSRESLEKAANRILHQLTGLQDVYMEQLRAFGDPKRDPLERTISIAYYALIDIALYKEQLNEAYRPGWFSLKGLPKLIFDHEQMVHEALAELQYKAALHPVLFELLPGRFTVPQIFDLYRAVYGKELDKRNFTRKLLSTKLLIRQKEKDKDNSRKGAWFYKVDKRKYTSSLRAFISFLPTRDIFK